VELETLAKMIARLQPKFQAIQIHAFPENNGEIIGKWMISIAKQPTVAAISVQFRAAALWHIRCILTSRLR
jgi:hypothetical protein